MSNHLTIAELMKNSFAMHSHLPALKVGGLEITYQELWDRSSELAATLLQAGADNSAIGIVGQRKVSSYIGVLATLICGSFYTPLNPKYSKKRLSAIIEDAQIRTLVGDATELSALGYVLEDPGLQGFATVVCPDGYVKEKSHWLGKEELGTFTDGCALQQRNPGNLAYLLYTSGSTGRPKGVQVTNHNLISFLDSMVENYDLEPGFRASQTFDLSFDPSVSDMYFTWLKGGVLCVLPEQEMMLPFDYINREKITFWNSVPTVASFMHKMGFLSPGCFPHITHSMFCGEQFPKHIADAWQLAAPNSSIENLYGPTEATIYISRFVYEKTLQNPQFRNGIVPIGKPFINHQCALVSENETLVSNGDVGEIIFKGPQISNGYLNDQINTSKVFVSFSWDEEGGTWYKTGDLGFVNADGQIECIGRKDNQIKIAGRRIETGEIESALNRYEMLSDVVVVPVFGQNNVVTCCVAFTRHAITEEVENYIRKDSIGSLERIFFPKKIFTVEEMPTNHSGKIDRKKLSELAAEIMIGKT